MIYDNRLEKTRRASSTNGRSLRRSPTFGGVGQAGLLLFAGGIHSIALFVAIWTLVYLSF